MEDSPSKKRRKATFRDVGPSLSKEELVRRLKTAAQGLTGVDQGEETKEFDGFSASLASSFIFHHKDKDVKSYAACCFADILRIYAPEPPYNEDQLKDILTLLVDQLKGLDVKENGPSYKRNFYILESLALVKTFNVSMELDAQDIVLNLFKLFLSIVSDGHNARVTSFMLDIMSPLIQEGDSIPPDLLSVILSYLINPKKAKKPQSYKLACDLIERCSTAIEPHIQVFFNNALVLGNKVDKELDDHLYDLMFELYKVNKSVLMSVLPQLEFKLKGNDEGERLEAVKLLGRMFSNEDLSFAESNKLLWNCYLGRFRDISPEVRIECIIMSKPFIISSLMQLRIDITDHLSERFLDPDEKVRSEVLHVVYEAAIDNLEVIDDKLIEGIKERMRDKKWNIRREAITCVGKIYKKIMASSTSKALIQKISWVPTKSLHQYILSHMDDRLCIERVVHGCLVPVTLNAELRMKRLFQMYTSFDSMAKILFDNMLQQRAKISKDFCEFLTTIKDEEVNEKEKIIHRLSIMIARALPEPIKTQEHLKKLILLCSDGVLYNLFRDSTNVDNDCPKIIRSVGDIVKKLTSKNPIIETVKSLLDRACPMLVDKSSFVFLLKQIQQYLNGFGDDEDDDLTENELFEKGKLALKLVQTLSKVRPTIFQTKQSYEVLLVFLKHKDKEIVEQTLKCLTKVINDLQDVDKSLFSCYKPILNKLVVTGSSKQSKYALRCLHTMIKDSSFSLNRLYNTLVDNLDPEENCYALQATLAALGEMAVLAPEVFEMKRKEIVNSFIVNKTMLVDREKTSSPKEPDDEWGSDSDVSEETNMKVQAIKLLVKWLLGLSSDSKDSALPVLRLLCTLLNNDGDLTGDRKVGARDRSRLRLAAGCAILKLAQQVKYVDMINLEHYHQVSLVIQDSCFEVREKFTTKLHKGLETLRLPPDYLAVLALVAVDPSKERKHRVKQMIAKNAQTRRDYSSQNSAVAARPYAVLPEYSLPYVVHLLAHHPDFDHKNNKSLHETKEYLWFFLEPIMGAKAENYSFLKKLLENIKRTKDKQNPDDTTINEKIYAVCDLAIACIMQKTQTFTLKDFPGNVVLPTKLFIAEKNLTNNKSYLPKGFVFSPKKQKSATLESKPSQKNNPKKDAKKVVKRALSDNEAESSDDDQPLRSPPKKTRISSGKSPKTSFSKKSSSSSATESSTKKRNVSTNESKSSIQKVKRNINDSPKKKESEKNSPNKNIVQHKNTSGRSVRNKSPTKSPKKSPAKKRSPKKRQIEKQMNGHDKSDSENEMDVSDEEPESDGFNVVLDEKPAKTKSASPSPKKNKNVRMTKTRAMNGGSPSKTSPRKTVKSPVNELKPASKLKIRRKVRGRR